jgi:Na+/proline symporter
MYTWSTEAWPWYIVLGQFVWIFSIPVQPHLVTRFLSAKNERSILIALPACLTAGLIIYLSTVPIGLLGQAASAGLADGSYYYVVLARSLLGPWIGAFALAGIAAAALSTSSTGLIVTGQSLSREIYQKWLVPDATDRQALVAARTSIFVVGAITFGIAYFQFLSIFWLVVLSASLLASVFFVPIFAGLFTRTASATGALAAMVSGGLVALVVFAINKQLGTHYFVSELFAGIVASIIAMLFANHYSPSTAAERAVVDSISTSQP